MNTNTAPIDVNIPIDVFLPCYRHLVPYSPTYIELIFGGRDSGKSRFVASVLVLYCLHAKNFRCALVRKVFNTIKDSQWQMIKDVVEAWGLDDLFVFNTSPLEIRCINGNRFIARGFDEPGKIKSLTNVQHAWVEEADQLNANDFITLMSTLRSNMGRVKTWVTFNPEADGHYEDFWLYKMFYANYSGDMYSTFTNTWQIKIPIFENGISSEKSIDFVYRSTHTTYHDNYYVDDIRKAFLESLAELDPYFYQVYTLGKWGNRTVGDPYCLLFDEKKHVRRTNLIPELEAYLSFDFNINPITCGVYQHYEDFENVHIQCVEAIKLPNSNIYALCENIKLKYPDLIYIVTGDATGKASSALVKDDLDYYKVIKQELDLADTQMKVPSVNPVVKENRMLVNAAFKKLDIAFDPVRAKDLIFDCQYVSVDDMGNIDKGDRSNPKKRADHLDHWRYYLNTFHKYVLTR